jgi:hypothetical protein
MTPTKAKMKPRGKERPNRFSPTVSGARFAEPDRRRLVGRYSGILLHVRDNQDWNLPVTRGRGLQKITVAWAGSSPLANGIPALIAPPSAQDVAVCRTPPNGSTRRVNIHPDRVFILGDYTDDAIGFLEPSYNAFVNRKS